jgi:hypothetical protein
MQQTRISIEKPVKKILTFLICISRDTKGPEGHTKDPHMKEI